MTSKRNTINDRIDKMAATAKRTAAKVAAAKERATAATTKQMHEAGQQLKDAGEKIMKKADGR
jgi:hypothetical protein